MQVTKSSFRLKVYPYGGFSVTREKETASLVPKIYSQGWKSEKTALRSRTDGLSGVCLDFQTKYHYPSDLGLSSVSNSHRVDRKRRGLGGFTSANKHRVKSAAWLMQERYGRKHLSFLTLTLPPRFVNGSSERNAELIRQFVQSIKRVIEKRSIWRGIVGVVEIQAERFEREKVCALHWHLLFVGRSPYGSWYVTANEVRDLWRRALSNVFGVVVPVEEVLPSVDVQRVKKSAASYLGKYLSKGSGIIEAVVSCCGADVIPTSWMVCSHDLKKWVDTSIVRRKGDSAKIALDVLSEYGNGLLKYGKHLFNTLNDGLKIWLAFYGELTQKGNSFCVELP